eukprot:TRINITY_DN2721_c0_g1_i2.p1 TRINITY_DN2721_c0_g1~~TRINITY_DN2721_c0_g1_i2.p1  ORF type:complete len:276 (-),score=-1.37 TRINITY_DN2721_c0_g1_i2:1198-2025(-)
MSKNHIRSNSEPNALIAKNKIINADKDGKLDLLPFLLGKQTVYKSQRELEPVQCPDQAVARQNIRLRSKISQCKVKISFVNCTDLIVGALWVNHLGQEVSYGLILPHHETIYQSYTYHPWVIRSMGDGCRMCLVTRQQRDQQHCQSKFRAQQVVMCTRARTLLQVFIHKPPTIPWNMKLHKLFFDNGNQLIETIQEVLVKKGIHDDNFTQFLVDKLMGNLAPKLYYDIALHSHLVDLDSINGMTVIQNIQPLMVPDQLQSLILKHPQVIHRRFIQ